MRNEPSSLEQSITLNRDNNTFVGVSYDEKHLVNQLLPSKSNFCLEQTKKRTTESSHSFLGSALNAMHCAEYHVMM